MPTAHLISRPSLIYAQLCMIVILLVPSHQWRRQNLVTGEVRYRSVGGLEYEVPQKLTHLLQCTHILHNFWTSTHRGELPPFPPL